jgi:hypothetical protein
MDDEALSGFHHVLLVTGTTHSSKARVDSTKSTTTSAATPTSSSTVSF